MEFTPSSHSRELNRNGHRQDLDPRWADSLPDQNGCNSFALRFCTADQIVDQLVREGATSLGSPVRYPELTILRRNILNDEAARLVMVKGCVDVGKQLAN